MSVFGLHARSPSTHGKLARTELLNHLQICLAWMPLNVVFP